MVYPNPFTDFIMIKNAEKVDRIILTDPSGVIVQDIENPSSLFTVENSKPGLYILTIKMKDGMVKSEKLIKK